MLKHIRIVALASFVEGLITFAWLASIPASGGTFSPIRLTSLLGILFVSLGNLAVYIYTRSENRLTKTIERLANSGKGILLSFLMTTLSLTIWVTILYKDPLLSLMSEAVYIRLIPIALLAALLCLQLGLLFLPPNSDKDPWINIPAPIWKPALILLGCFLAVWGLMSATHIGFIFDNVGLSWGPPGTPLSFPQINLIFSVSVLLAFAWKILHPKISPKTFPFRDAVIFAGLWVLAVFLWWNEPVSVTHFNPPPMAPNYETYPNSDALIFDKSAYHLMDGIGFRDQLTRRPLYVGMLALFHKIGGFDYVGTIFVQILILAFIPSLVYLLTSNLSNRLAGLIAGGLILLREKNAIELSGKIVTSNAKLMMSDMVAMLGVIAFVYVMTRILSGKKHNIWLLLIAGASLGLTALVRAQVLILVPLALLFILLERRPLKLGAKESSLIILGLVLVMSSWVWRNWNLTHTFVLDDRGEEKLLARNYSPNPVAFPPLLPGESEQEYSARIKREVFAYIFEHPLDVASFVSNHFLRNIAVSAVYIAPLYSPETPYDLISKLPYWDEWMGITSSNGRLSLFLTLTIVALGIAVSQTGNKYAGWFPLAVFLVYSAGNALVRTSGWRFSLPVDWVFLVYYSCALAYLPSKIRMTLGKDDSLQPDLVSAPVIKRPFPVWIIFFILLLAGASVPIAERIVPARDLSDLPGKATEQLSAANLLTPSRIANFLEQENAVLYSGVALYPRYITPKSKIYLAYAPRDYSFIHFWLINDGDNQIIFPAGNSRDVLLYHHSTVSIMGCKQDNYVVAWALIVHSSPPQILVQDIPLPLSCPMDIPDETAQ